MAGAGPEPLPRHFVGHDFRWVCGALASRAFPPPHLPLVDTVVIERGRPALWLSCAHAGADSGGAVVARRVGDGDTREIFNSFAEASLGYLRNSVAQRACVAHYSVGLPQVLSRAAFATHATVGFLVATCIQPFVQSQGCSRLPTNLRYEFLSSLDPELMRDPSVPRIPVFQYLESGGGEAPQPGVPSFRMVPSSLANPPIPDDVVARMEAVTQQLIFYLHRACPQERVVKLVTEFSLDDNGQLWLVYVPDVRTEHNPLLVMPPTEAEAPPDRPLPPAPLVELADGSLRAVHRLGLPVIAMPVTIKDLVDLRNSPSPHPGLQAVGCTLVQAVLGGAPRPWARAVGVLRGSGCDEFFLRMRQLERAPQRFIDEQRLADLRATVTSEAFDVAALRHLGLLAETLGAWVLAVTQAALEWYGCPGYGDLPLLQFVYGEAAAAAASRVALARVGAVMATRAAPSRSLLEAAGDAYYLQLS